MNENQNLKPSTSSTKIFIFIILTAIFPLFVIPLLYFYNKNLKQQKEVETQLDKFKESFNNSTELSNNIIATAHQTSNEIINSANTKASEIINSANNEATNITTNANQIAENIINQASVTFASKMKRINQHEVEVMQETQKLEDDAKRQYHEKLDNLIEQEENLRNELADINLEILRRTLIKNNLEDAQEEYDEANEKLEKINNQIANSKKKIKQARLLAKNAYEVVDKYFRNSLPEENIESIANLVDELESIYPEVSLHFNALDYQDLRKEFKENEKFIKEISQKYIERNTLKTYQAIYKLMILGLNAELQNIIYNLKYTNLDKCRNQVEEIINKYISIATEGNHMIEPSLLAFITEIKAPFLRAVEIEYQYYVKREKAREEQAAIREQIRQEAAERKQLEEERKQVEKEEQKFHLEIKNISEQISTSEDDAQTKLLKERLAELESQLAAVSVKKEEIINLQNGKAGYVYIISNLGSFGDKMFKIGMTRRIDPQDRVDELGSASVPFKFDVHSFIFSEDAVSLESELHKRLNDRRVNKINMRKEFFNCSIEELEKLVLEIEPTAPFTTTMLAEQYRQTLELEAENESK